MAESLLHVQNRTIVGIYEADFHNKTARNFICQFGELDEEGCDRWIKCCQEAENCCQRQLAVTASMTTTHQSTYSHYCPKTWDGYSCWNDTPAGTTVTQPCPGFLEYSLTSGN